MNRRFLVIGGLLLFAGLVFTFFLHRYVNSPFRDVSFTEPGFGTNPLAPEEAPAVALDPSRRVRVAIGSLGLPDDTENRRLGDLVTAGLSSADRLELVERQSLEAALREAELSLAGLVRAKDAVRVGRLLRADWFLLGSLASAGTSNAVIARVVDARTGIMREVGVFPYEPSLPRLADRLAGFVQQCRQAAGKSQARAYLAIGAFEDVSVNSRQASFPSDLRAYLTAAYRQDPRVTLLEREYVNALLQEVRLDLAGLTDQGGANPPARMQSAFWLVEGYYQSYETSGLEIEIGLNIQRIFGRQTTVMLRDRPGEPLFKKVKDATDVTLSSNTSILAPTRISEVRAQMNNGKELAGLNDGRRMLTPSYFIKDDQQIARQTRNVKEAIRAFETVLLLEPTNRAAKMCLAAALRDPGIGRDEEAREYYREIILEPAQDQWSLTAQQALQFSFYLMSAEERVRWCESAAGQGTNSPAAEFFRREAEQAARDIAIQRGEGPKVQDLAEARLFEKIKSFDAGRFYQSEIGMDDFAATFGADRAAAARRLNELFPKMKAQAPDSVPYLLATLVTFQVDTNAPIIAEFERTLDWCAEHPKQLPVRIGAFWNHLRGAYKWGLEHKLYSLSVKIMEAKFRARAVDPGIDFTLTEDEDKMRLAFAYKALQSWTNALGIFESYSNQPVYLGNSGPWGPAFSMVLTSRQAAHCREKLGLPPARDAREFDLGDPLMCLCRRDHTSDSQLLLAKFGAFAAAADGLWIGIGGQLLHLDFNLKTNLVINLPIAPSTPITSLCVDPARIWIATGGEGLVEYETNSRQCSRLTQKDGLMLDFVSALQPIGGALWIGYGQESSGGLGKLDLKTRVAKSLTSSLTETNTAKRPTRSPVASLATGAGEDVWMAAQYSLCRYRGQDDTWDALSNYQPVRSVASSAEKLFVGTGFWPGTDPRQPKGLGVSTLDFKDGRWKSFPAIAGLPRERVTTLTVDGQNVWVGGMGYIALLDPAKDEVLKLAYVCGRSVEQIQVAGGYVWAQFEHHLYRAPVEK